MFQLDCAQIAGKRRLLGVSEGGGGAVPEEIHSWVGGLNEAGVPPQCRRAASDPLRV